MLPEKLSSLIDSLLLHIETDSNSLDALTRYEIYESFGVSRLHLQNEYEITKKRLDDNYYNSLLKEIENYTIADFALSWLTVITAEKILPIWNEYWCSKSIEELVDIIYIDSIITPYRILLLSKNVLLGIAKVDQKIFNIIYDLSLGMEIQENIPYKISCVYASVFQSLSLIGYSGRNLSKHFIFDDDTSFNRIDFASEAVKAYSCVADDFIAQNSSPSLLFDTNKRVEFWRWWLTEAIPQAWQLAHFAFANKTSV